jgi:hypothetical protein
MIEACQAMGSINEKLASLSQITQPEWLVEAMMNMNINIFMSTNEESLNIP